MSTSGSNMANDSFNEALHKLKEIYDKEVLGMQAKLTELTMEKCRDSQRIEELFSKNHLLREQHKVLNENIKVLENRLRAGLCDRCTVTQELAKKKQQDYEKLHFHNLQQICSLSNEISLLKEENRSLLQEMRKVQCVDEWRSPRSHTPENGATPEDQHPSLPTANPKNNTEKTSKDREMVDNNPDQHTSEETCAAVLRLSPLVKNFQMSSEVRPAEMRMSGVQKVLLNTHPQQKISNQLHGTIALMRSGSKSGRSATLSPVHKRSGSNEVHPRESCTDVSEPSSPLEPLKHIMPEEQFNLLRQHFAQKCLAQRSSGVPSEGPIRHLVAKNHEVVQERKHSEEDWEDKSVAMAKLHGAVLYLREQAYKNKMNPSNQREKIQYLLSKQNQGLRSPNSPSDLPKCLVREDPEEKELSLIQVLSARWRNSMCHYGQEEEQDWADKDTKSAETENRSHYEEDATPDKPLDLSDTRRGQQAAWSDIQQEQKYLSECCARSPDFRNNTSPPARVPNSNHLHEAGMEDCAMMPRSTLKRDCEGARQDSVMDYSGSREANSEVRRPGSGHKRHRDSESDEEEVGHSADGDSSHQDMDGELDTSPSEEEMENSHNSSAATSRDSCTSEEKHGERRWKKNPAQASKKSLKKKQKLEDEEKHGTGKELERERPA